MKAFLMRYFAALLFKDHSYLHHASAENFYIQDAKGPLNYFFIYFNTIRKKKLQSVLENLNSLAP